MTASGVSTNSSTNGAPAAAATWRKRSRRKRCEKVSSTTTPRPDASTARAVDAAIRLVFSHSESSITVPPSKPRAALIASQEISSAPVVGGDPAGDRRLAGEGETAERDEFTLHRVFSPPHPTSPPRGGEELEE